MFQNAFKLKKNKRYHRVQYIIKVDLPTITPDSIHIIFFNNISAYVHSCIIAEEFTPKNYVLLPIFLVDNNTIMLSISKSYAEYVLVFEDCAFQWGVRNIIGVYRYYIIYMTFRNNI